MPYLTCWNCRQIFSWTEIRSKRIQITLLEIWSFISFEIRHLNSLKVSQNAKFGRSFFSAENEKKTKISTLTTVSTLPLWHEPDIRLKLRNRRYFAWHWQTAMLLIAILQNMLSLSLLNASFFSLSERNLFHENFNRPWIWKLLLHYINHLKYVTCI